MTTETTDKPEDRCECGHLRSEHAHGGFYCGKGVQHGGCYTSQAQRDHCVAQGMPDAPVCSHFREAT